MIEITFRGFYECKYSEETFHELYVMKNGLSEVLYVGISSQNIWSRWFGWNGHIIGDARLMIGASEIGQKIVDYLPDSWNWKIQLWTLDDCLAFCADELNPQGRYTIKFLEPIIIQRLHPVLNVAYNLNPGVDHMPKSEIAKKREAELDKGYHDIFEGKKK
ncbi:MAG: hypothetical protein IPO22_19705 [Anaerolineales bacterium]|nr:hypothetical protein [Anaerolineales bacterium]